MNDEPVWNWSKQREIPVKDHNYPSILVNLRSLIGKDVRVRETREGETFERALNVPSECSVVTTLEPSSDFGHFYNIGFDTGEPLYGYFCGDPNLWIPVLIREHIVMNPDIGRKTAWIGIAIIEFPAGTIVLETTRKVATRKILRKRERVRFFSYHESFVVYGLPVRAKSFRTISRCEIIDYASKADEMSGLDDATFFKEESIKAMEGR